MNMSRQNISGRNSQTGKSIEVICENGIVREIRESTHEEDAWLSCGLIDLQVNGYGGDDVNLQNPDPGTIISLTQKMIATGVTTYLPTIITASEAEITARLRAVAAARRHSKFVADSIPYIHVEGPSISEKDGPRGAHRREYIRPPCLAEFERWQNASEGLVGMVTLSPEFPESAEYIRKLSSRGIHIAIGHSEASPEQIRRAVDAGARLSTHLGNGIASMIPRHINMLWPQLADDRLTATMIADGHHIPDDMLKTMIRAKGYDRAVLVSDAVALAGMPAGMYDTAVGGTVELHSNGRLSLAGTEFLAGAARPLKDGVARLVLLGVPLHDSLRMATENPGRFVRGMGMLRVGAPADLIRFTVETGANTLRIERVIAKGQEWPIETM
jgi:N-acetylglucosamine-6-phosphate deacetylase